MAEKIKFSVGQRFFDAFAALPRSKQGRISDFITKLMSNPLSPGLNYEKINDSSDKNMRSLRVDDTYRAIVLHEGNTIVLLWVDHHDEAYDWARRKRCNINAKTGSIQIYEPTNAAAQETAEPDVASLFGKITDAQLEALGVPEELYALVRSVVDREGFFAIEENLPEEVFAALELCLDNDVEEVIEYFYGDSGDNQAHDIASALEKPITQMMFTVIDVEEELRAMLDAPLEDWRVFLHPTQRRLATKDFSGPARVLGGAGTGKTVVAMHRARYLAQHCKENERILFTTFTANLAQDIGENLKKICTPEEMRKIEVVHLDAWFTQYLRQRDYEYEISYGEDFSELWEAAAREIGDAPNYPEGFFEEEWKLIVQAQGIATLEEYIEAPRAGRGIRLDRKQRIEAWKVFEAYRAIMNHKKMRDPAWAMNECFQILKEQPNYRPYVSIIVDESQDFGMEAFRLLRTLAGEEHRNDLFIVGDAHQRIYRNKVILSQCGIFVHSRSSQLRVNYRTTEEIRAWAMRLLKGIQIDDLDGGIDDAKGYRSLVHGDAPTVETYPAQSDEIAALLKHIQEKMDAGVKSQEICVIARTNGMLTEYAKALNGAGIRTYEIKSKRIDDREMPGVRLATMHRVKGLEFTCVFIVGMTKAAMPHKSAIRGSDPLSREEAINGERCLLYVAITRAKQAAYIMAYGQASQFITEAP